jgi:hypothetical protein
VKAIVPLNVAALRVSNPDSTNVTPTGAFAGRTAAFDLLPRGQQATEASTGDTIWLPLGAGTPSDPLGTGIHLHWELPEYFKRGRQDPDTSAITFPAAPTRWLVVRTLSVYNATTSSYGPPRQASWVVESDYVSPQLLPDQDGIVRPAVSVPLTAPDKTPYMFMGRVVKAAGWSPGPAASYLPNYKDTGGNQLYLTSIGFVGAAFSGYYPDCRSVFGFWDTFADLNAPGDIYEAISGNTAGVRFRVSYSVIGWLPAVGDDPLSTLPADVLSQYNQYVSSAKGQQAKVTRTPADVFNSITTGQYGWQFSGNAISPKFAADGQTLTAVDVPDGTLCAGVIGQVVWDQTNSPFLVAESMGQPWQAPVDIAMGNTTVQAVSALVKNHLAAPAAGSAPVLQSYETLLNALQLGVLRDLEGQGNTLSTLEETLHSRGFAGIDGGHRWTIQTKAAPGSQSSVALTLPLPLAEQLATLNSAQLAYDQARSRLLTARQQLFMDWIIYVKQLCKKPPDTYVIPTNTLSAFLAAGTSELKAVTTAAATAGLLHYQTDQDQADQGTGRITGVTADGGASSLAGQVVIAYQTVATALAALPDGWELDAVPADSFWQATDPVLVLEGDRLEPARRNGPDVTIAVRADSELIGELTVAGAAPVTVSGLIAPPSSMPAAQAAAAVIGEAALLDPAYAPVSAAAATTALYGAVHTAGYQRTEDPVELTVTFGNAGNIALPPDAVGWNDQTPLPEFSPTRLDPFLPVWLIWEGRLYPLDRDQSVSYPAGTLADRFILATDEIDLGYPVPVAFTAKAPVTYDGAVVLSKKPFVSLTQQINTYLTEYPGDQASTALTSARDYLAGRKVMSQAMDTFSLVQTLRTTIPQLPVQNLVITVDPTTTAIAKAAATSAAAGDNWYDTGFNSLAPISTGPAALYNYGPLRAGFLELTKLTIVDVYGQMMTLTTPAGPTPGVLGVTAASDLAPVTGDTANTGRAYLPPRVLAPGRVDARWLSAAFDTTVPGFTDDFTESNDHPATSPVCGWIVPNHLDLLLAFYDADGSPIGSFGLEHGASKYRTHAGNTENLTDDLDTDLGPDSASLVNVHVARLMRFVDGKGADFLTDLMATIEQSDQYINPAGSAQDAALSVLIGRPLAILRTLQSISTSGGVLPASQADNTTADALNTAVTGKLYDYVARAAGTTAGLGQVSIPVRLGELTDIDDGLVAFLPEVGTATEPYTTVYSDTAPSGGAHSVVVPGPDTVELTFNGPAKGFTLIADPRSPVHVNTGILPTATMQLPPEQYLQDMQRLAVTFTARPVLSDQLGLRLPLPAEVGFSWSWVAAGAPPVPLNPAAAPDVPAYGYSPQQLQEGWLDLIPIPPGEGTPSPRTPRPTSDGSKQ